MVAVQVNGLQGPGAAFDLQAVCSGFVYALTIVDGLLRTGALLVLFLVGLTEFNDIAQYLWGKSIGRIKVMPKVSPNKTLAGLVGGVVTTTLMAAVLGPVMTPLNLPLSLLAGFKLKFMPSFAE